MKGWLIVGLKLGLVLVVPGALVAVSVGWLVRRRRRIRIFETTIEAQRRYRYVPGMETADESLPVQARVRRDLAAQLRKEATAIEQKAETGLRRKLSRFA